MADPDTHFERITELLERHQGLAEYEVARFFVSRFWQAPVERKLRSVDPLERLKGGRHLPLLFSSTTAARLFRQRVKDPDTRVAQSARATVRELGLADVALPELRGDPRYRHGAVGGWNPTGWNFGLFANQLWLQAGEASAAHLGRAARAAHPGRRGEAGGRGLHASRGAAPLQGPPRQLPQARGGLAGEGPAGLRALVGGLRGLWAPAGRARGRRCSADRGPAGARRPPTSRVGSGTRRRT
ncbi:MAG TPA: hypothetical protein VEU33_13830 [Archangium sp.]|nr:hypothetical protein [Archangium sp.]